MPPQSHVIWNSSCDGILIETLFKQRQDGMQTSNGNWHMDAWGSAKIALSGTKIHTGGAAKTGTSCQNQWAAPKKEYCEVKNLCELSGFGWDNTHSLVTADNNVWDSLLTAHPKLKKWHTTSFLLFDEMANLIEGTYATGTGVYHPGHDSTPVPSDSDTDEEENAIDPYVQQLSSSLALQSTQSATPSATHPASTVNATPSMEPSDNSSSCKCDAADLDNSASAKCPQTGHGHKQSSGNAISGMASSIAQLASAFTNDAAVPSPQCKHAAIHTIEDDGDLSENEMIKVYKIIWHDTTFADTILAIWQKGSHTCFIKSELYDD